jgi:tRNA G46 methylase TrmB
MWPREKACRNIRKRTREKLEAGVRVADVGCGKGASTLLMAKAFPKSRFFGFDYHDKSIEAARDSAKREG